MNQLSDFHRERVQTVLAASPLIPVIAINDPDDAIPLCRALVDGGIRVLEITLRTEFGLAAISIINQTFPEAIIAAGTVTTPEEV
ncbi:MAG: keto-deoxy-phosphogluconate aldolase, partial [Marinobacter sp.]